MKYFKKLLHKSVPRVHDACAFASRLTLSDPMRLSAPRTF